MVSRMNRGSCPQVMTRFIRSYRSAIRSNISATVAPWASRAVCWVVTLLSLTPTAWPEFLLFDDAVDRQRGTAQGLAEAVEPEERIRSVCWDIEFFHTEGVDGDVISVGAVTSRWCRTDKAPVPAVVFELEGAFWQARTIWFAGIFGQFGDIGGNVADRPVPESGTGWGVWVKDRHGVRLRTFWGARPGQMRRNILTAGHTHGA